LGKVADYRGGNTVQKADKTRVDKYKSIPQHVSDSFAGIYKKLFPVKAGKPPGGPQ
jgi:hypothetical protein